MEKGILKEGDIAVIFISVRPETTQEYEFFDEATLNSAKEVKGFLGWDSVRSEPDGIFISYWNSEEAVEEWKRHQLHVRAKEMGRTQFYSFYRSMITKVQRVSEFGDQKTK